MFLWLLAIFNILDSMVLIELLLKVSVSFGLALLPFGLALLPYSIADYAKDPGGVIIRIMYYSFNSA